MMGRQLSVAAQSITDPARRRDAVFKGLLAPECFDTWQEMVAWALVALIPLAYVANEGRVIEALSTDRALVALVALGAVHVGQSLLDLLFIAQNPFMTSRIPAHTTLIDKELDGLSRAYVRFNRWQTIPYALAVAYYAGHSKNIYHNWEEVTFLNSVGIIPLWLVMYDAVYYWFHRFLHVKTIYPYIHKHHHQNVSPYRGNIDGINTHPVEYVIGMYLHLFCMAYGPKHSIHGLYFFTIVYGIMASINHTRFDLRIPGIFHTKDHDAHHQHFFVCYGQYVMVWDQLFGTFKKPSSPKAKK